MPIPDSDIKFYLTTATFGSAQTNPSFSTGGFASTTEADFDTLFNDRFGENEKQYRCVAIKNVNTSDSANNVSFYLQSPSDPDSSVVKIAVEQALSDAHAATATGGTINTVIDGAITGYSNNYFANAYVQILSGANSGAVRKVLSFDSTSKTFVVATPFTTAIVTGVSYVVHAGACQRGISSVVSPTFGSGRASALSLAPTASASITIDQASRQDSDDLKPYDVAYVWFERSLSLNRSGGANGVTLGMRFTR